MWVSKRKKEIEIFEPKNSRSIVLEKNDSLQLRSEYLSQPRFIIK